MNNQIDVAIAVARGPHRHVKPLRPLDPACAGDLATNVTGERSYAQYPDQYATLYVHWRLVRSQDSG